MISCDPECHPVINSPFLEKKKLEIHSLPLPLIPGQQEEIIHIKSIILQSAVLNVTGDTMNMNYYMIY